MSRMTVSKVREIAYAHRNPWMGEAVEAAMVYGDNSREKILEGLLTIEQGDEPLGFHKMCGGEVWTRPSNQVPLCASCGDIVFPKDRSSRLQR